MTSSGNRHPKTASHFVLTLTSGSGSCSRGVYFAAATCEFRDMKELIRTNDAVIISFVEALMRDAGIDYFVADQNMSVLDGSLGILPRRIMVDADEIGRARTILADAGIGNEIKHG
jgi:hypothetical protein